MSNTPNIKLLEQQAADAIESGDPADAQRFAHATGMQPNEFQALLQAQGPAQLELSVQAHLDQSGNMQGVTVHDFNGRFSGDVYDQTQTDNAIKDGDILDLGGGNVAILVKAWPTIVVGEIEHFHKLQSGEAFETLEGGKYAASVVKAHEVASKGTAGHLQMRAPDACYTDAISKGAAPASQKLATAELTGLAFDWAVATAIGRVVSGSFVYRDFNGNGLHEYSIKAPAAVFSPWRDRRTLERIEEQAGVPAAELLRQKFGPSVAVPMWVIELHNEQLEIDGRVSALQQRRVENEEAKTQVRDDSSPSPGM